MKNEISKWLEEFMHVEPGVNSGMAVTLKTLENLKFEMETLDSKLARVVQRLKDWESRPSLSKEPITKLQIKAILVFLEEDSNDQTS